MAIRDSARAVKMGEDATHGLMAAASARELLLARARCKARVDCFDAVFGSQARRSPIGTGR